MSDFQLNYHQTYRSFPATITRPQIAICSRGFQREILEDAAATSKISGILANLMSDEQIYVKSTKIPRVRHGVLVLGMHRSGTSAMAGVLGKLGCSLPKDLMGAGIGNEKGHWEPQGAVSINDQILESGGSHWEDWDQFNPAWYNSLLYTTALDNVRSVLRESFGDEPLFVLKDPRICKLLPLWIGAFEAEAITPAIVLCLRHPSQVATSLESRDCMERGYTYLLWLRYTLEAEKNTRGYKRTISKFEKLVDDWQYVASKVSRDLGIVWPRDSARTKLEINDFFAKSSKINLDSVLSENDDIMPLARRTFSILENWSEYGEREENYKELDGILTKLNNSAEICSAILSSKSYSLGPGIGKILNQRLSELETSLTVSSKMHEEYVVDAEQKIASLKSSESALSIIAERLSNIEILNNKIESNQRLSFENSSKIGTIKELQINSESKITKAKEEIEFYKNSLLDLRNEHVDLKDNINKYTDQVDCKHTLLIELIQFISSRPPWWYILPAAWRLRREKLALKRRGLFDAKAYLELYPDVAAAGMDPIHHYLLYGMTEGRLPFADNENSNSKVSWGEDHKAVSINGADMA